MFLTDPGTTESPLLRQVSRQRGDSRAAQCGISWSLLADHTLVSQSRWSVWCGDAAVSKAAGRERVKRFQYSKVGIMTGSMGPCGNTDEGPLTQWGGLGCAVSNEEGAGLTKQEEYGAKVTLCLDAWACPGKPYSAMQPGQFVPRDGAPRGFVCSWSGECRAKGRGKLRRAGWSGVLLSMEQGADFTATRKGKLGSPMQEHDVIRPGTFPRIPVPAVENGVWGQKGAERPAHTGTLQVRSQGGLSK